MLVSQWAFYHWYHLTEMNNTFTLICVNFVSVVVQSRSHVWFFVTPWTAVCQVLLPLTIFQSLPTFMSIALAMPSSHLVLWCPLLLPKVFPASGTFPLSWLFMLGDQNTGASALSSASLFPANIQGWFDLRLTGLISLLSKALRSLLQHHNSKASILWRSAFYTIQLSQLYVTIGKIITLTIWTLVGRVMSCFSTHCLGFS